MLHLRAAGRLGVFIKHYHRFLRSRWASWSCTQVASPGFDEAGLAYLMRGLMDLTGIAFDVEGRLRSGAPR